MNFYKLLQERAESLVNAGRYRDYNLDLLLTKFFPLGFLAKGKVCRS